MEENNIYKKIQDAISSLPQNFSVLEEQIDIELQMEYFNYARDLKPGFTPEVIMEHRGDLFDESVPLDEKKNLLVLFASLEKVEAFRIIEKYAKNPDPELREWSILALQESRMVLQSSLMDEQQVYISTGLGGRGQKLRYFVVMIGRDDNADYSPVQKKLVQTELEYAVKHNDGELEEVTFDKNMAIALMLLPVKSDLQGVFSSVINECNQYGDFIRPDIIITNVKRMTVDEIKKFVNKRGE
ncbi:MAG: hypothetical protein ACM3O8_14180 [Methylococcaceae bacterium]|nr:hypothetical protein [Prolixibacteraceae bacterium]